MTLQGVTILRITDLKRFFSYHEFIQKKEEFQELLNKDKYGCFYDNAFQMALGVQVATWLGGNTPNVMVNHEKLVIDISGALSGECREHCKFDRLKPFVEQLFNEKIFEKDRNGLIALYLLLGANEEDSDINPNLSLSSYSNQNKSPRILYQDTTIPMSKKNSSLEQCFFVNGNTTSKRKIKLTFGEQIVELKAGACIASLVDNEGNCVEYFKHELHNQPKGLSCYLMYDIEKNQSYLKVDKPQPVGTKNIKDVFCFDIEPMGLGVEDFLTYLTNDGILHYDHKSCFALAQYEKSTHHKKILAYRRISYGNYMFFSPTGPVY